MLSAAFSGISRHCLRSGSWRLGLPRGIASGPDSSDSSESGSSSSDDESPGKPTNKQECEVAKLAEAAAVEAGAGDVKKTSSGLLDRLAMIGKETEMEKSKSLMGMIGGLRVEKISKGGRKRPRKGNQQGTGMDGVALPPRPETTSDFVKSHMEASQRRLNARKASRISGDTTIPDIFSGPTLGLFEPGCSKKPQITENPVWAQIEAGRLQILRTRSPANGFEEQIEWTKAGKMWRYPIDNEVDWPEEETVDFREHIFLEPVLDELNFPKQGPIRQFMDLVANGLSKNPYMTVAKKREYLESFKTYFDEKGGSLERLMEEDAATPR